MKPDLDRPLNPSPPGSGWPGRRRPPSRHEHMPRHLLHRRPPTRRRMGNLRGQQPGVLRQFTQVSATGCSRSTPPESRSRHPLSRGIDPVIALHAGLSRMPPRGSSNSLRPTYSSSLPTAAKFPISATKTIRPSRPSHQRDLRGNGGGPATSMAGPPHAFLWFWISDRPKSAWSRGGRNSCRGRTPSPAC